MCDCNMASLFFQYLEVFDNIKSEKQAMYLFSAPFSNCPLVPMTSSMICVILNWYNNITCTNPLTEQMIVDKTNDAKCFQLSEGYILLNLMEA
jgi:hypothetical protein